MQNICKYMNIFAYKVLKGKKNNTHCDSLMYFFCAEISWVSALHVSVSEHQLGRLEISHPSLFYANETLSLE